MPSLFKLGMCPKQNELGRKIWPKILIQGRGYNFCGNFIRTKVKPSSLFTDSQEVAFVLNKIFILWILDLSSELSILGIFYFLLAKLSGLHDTNIFSNLIVLISWNMNEEFICCPIFKMPLGGTITQNFQALWLTFRRILEEIKVTSCNDFQTPATIHSSCCGNIQRLSCSSSRSFGDTAFNWSCRSRLCLFCLEEWGKFV